MSDDGGDERKQAFGMWRRRNALDPVRVLWRFMDDGTGAKDTCINPVRLPVCILRVPILSPVSASVSPS